MSLHFTMSAMNLIYKKNMKRSDFMYLHVHTESMEKLFNGFSGYMEDLEVLFPIVQIISPPL